MLCLPYQTALRAYPLGNHSLLTTAHCFLFSNKNKGFCLTFFNPCLVWGLRLWRVERAPIPAIPHHLGILQNPDLTWSFALGSASADLGISLSDVELKDAPQSANQHLEGIWGQDHQCLSAVAKFCQRNDVQLNLWGAGSPKRERRGW